MRLEVDFPDELLTQISNETDERIVAMAVRDVVSKLVNENKETIPDSLRKNISANEDWLTDIVESVKNSEDQD